MLHIRTTLCISLLVVLCLNGTAWAQYRLGAGSGGQQQIGTGLPLPIAAAGIFTGGRSASSAGAFPSLGVPPHSNYATTNPAATGTIWQKQNTTMGGTIVFAPGVLSQSADGVPNALGVFRTNSVVGQVATSVSYAWPAAYERLAPGSAPGPAVLGTALAGGLIAYSGGTKSFGGPGVFGGTPGPGAGTHRVPPNTAGEVPIATVWLNVFGALPGSAMTLAIVGAVAAGGDGGIIGASTGAPPVTTMFGPVSPGFGAVNVTTGGTAMNPVCCTVGPIGTVVSSIAVGGPGLTNRVMGSKGFPWTTGFITISQPAALPPELFFLSGGDSRVAGSGNISLVSGALSVRSLSGSNANRGWLSLNLVSTAEPGVVAGGTGAVFMLGLCHSVARGRSRPD